MRAKHPPPLLTNERRCLHTAGTELFARVSVGKSAPGTKAGCIPVEKLCGVCVFVCGVRLLCLLGLCRLKSYSAIGRPTLESPHVLRHLSCDTV